MRDQSDHWEDHREYPAPPQDGGAGQKRPVKWRLVEHPCPAVHPDGGLCQLEVDGHTEHVYTAWEDCEIVGPVYWEQT